MTCRSRYRPETAFHIDVQIDPAVRLKAQIIQNCIPSVIACLMYTTHMYVHVSTFMLCYLQTISSWFSVMVSGHQLFRWLNPLMLKT